MRKTLGHPTDCGCWRNKSSHIQSNLRNLNYLESDTKSWLMVVPYITAIYLRYDAKPFCRYWLFFVWLFTNLFQIPPSVNSPGDALTMLWCRISCVEKCWFFPLLCFSLLRRVIRCSFYQCVVRSYGWSINCKKLGDVRMTWSSRNRLELLILRSLKKFLHWRPFSIFSGIGDTLISLLFGSWQENQLSVNIGCWCCWRFRVISCWQTLLTSVSRNLCLFCSPLVAPKWTDNM